LRDAATRLSSFDPDDLEMTREYTFVTPERHNELTRRIQQKLTMAKSASIQSHPELPPAAPARQFLH
jgi:hypothetical protein